MMPANKNKFTVRFRGVRGSHPVPGPGTVRFGGNTACVEVRAGNHLLILDAGTGIIGLGNDLLRDYMASGSDLSNRVPMTFTILFSHTHHDHTQGFAFFKPGYVPTSTCYLFGPRLMEEEFESGLVKSMISPYFPVELNRLPSMRKIKSLRESDVILYDESSPHPKLMNYYWEEGAREPHYLRVRMLHSLAHPNGGVFVYRIEHNGRSVVFATDTEGYSGGDQKLIAFANDATLLIHDSQYLHSDYIKSSSPVQGFGHSSTDMAAEVAQKANVGKLALFHFDPMYDDKALADMEKKAQAIFKNSVAAYEGLEIEV
jgi:phosphoribosyl 1,2-cyclic phosphodiesterase